MFEIIILALIQGISEFFPVSSSGHLLLIPPFLEKIVPALDFSQISSNELDVILHIATFFALLTVYRGKVIELLRKSIRSLGSLKSIFREKKDYDAGIVVLIASIPTIIAGALFFALGLVDDRQSEWIGVVTLIIVGILLIWVDFKVANDNDVENDAEKNANDVEASSASKPLVQNSRKISDLSYIDALEIGLWQMFAIIRGVSRSGITIIGALRRNMSRREAIDFAFLAGLPVFFVLTGVEVLKLFISGFDSLQIGIGQLIIGFIIAYTSALITILLFRNLVQKRGVLMFFGVYRILMAVIILISLL